VGTKEIAFLSHSLLPTPYSIFFSAPLTSNQLTASSALKFKPSSTDFSTL
jgi:hypothetical protein